ncbi:MAG: TonB-dependent receptor [Burkholderiaceae bacterium]
MEQPPTPGSRTIALAVAAACLQVAPARAQSPSQTPTRLDEVVVTADPLDRTELDLLRPAGTLRGDALRAAESTSLGETLGREPGVQSSAYGPGAGRPIIRGMDSARVRITESGLGVADVSGASPDHRVAADTLNARQVEILRGPATLLYGSGAIGGLVNIVSERVPRQRASEFGADANVRYSSVDRGRAGAFDLAGPLGDSTAWRLEGFKQTTGDYNLAAPLRDEGGNVIAVDRLPNSRTDTQSIATGASWFGRAAATRAGLAVQRYESDYGIPNPEDPVTIKLRRTRYELQADLGASVGPFAAVRSRFAYTDYAHTELEPGGAAGATFTNKGFEGRIELPHAFAGWRGALGVQLQSMQTRGSGEGRLPRADSTGMALFAVEERRFGSVRTELGGRADSERYKVGEDYEDGSRAPSRRFALTSLSGGATWSIAPAWELGATLTAAERAPAVEELYFLGAHPATFAFEIGNPNLRKEKSRNVDLSLRHAGSAGRAQLTMFVNRVRDYIYGFFDGSTTDVLDENGNVEETLSNLAFTQADALLRGAEAEVAWGGRTGAQVRLWGDTVRGKLVSGPNDGAYLPRMPPSRVGLDVGWKEANWSAKLAATRVFAQRRVSRFDLRDGEPEAPTPGYTRVDAGAAWRPAGAAVTVYLIGRNLTDADTRIHTSYLKHLAPPPGRSLVLGIQAAL